VLMSCKMWPQKSVRTTILRDFSGIVEVGHLDRQGIGEPEGVRSESLLQVALSDSAIYRYFIPSFHDRR
jgi:hypothetical protein